PERLKYYRRIAGAEKEEQLREIQRELLDRFGMLPPPVLALFDATRIRETARRIGVERVVLKDNILRLYFISDPQSTFFQTSVFGKVIEYVQHYPVKVKMKETPKYLSIVFPGTENIKEVLDHVRDVHDFVTREPKVEA
ncbi:MAG: hypothetical protein NWR72_13885, partial [Bacteroidia bacterium]|nr:hypothetical protein [Bacteroidia bacterium]